MGGPAYGRAMATWADVRRCAGTDRWSVQKWYPESGTWHDVGDPVPTPAAGARKLARMVDKAKLAEQANAHPDDRP